jgi:hypothetical protein
MATRLPKFDFLQGETASAMNLFLLLVLAIPLGCLALLVSLALLGVLMLGGVIRFAVEVGRSNIVPTGRPEPRS